MPPATDGAAPNEALAILGSAPPMAPDTSRRGELRDGDATLPSDGSLVDGYLVDAAPGTRLEASLTSTDFDAYLIVVDADGEIVVRNDDADGTDARLTFTVPGTGPVYVVANSYLVEGRGAYTLSLRTAGGTDGGTTGDPRFAPGGTIAVGGRVDGRLDGGDARHPADDAPMDVYTLQLGAGERVTIEARSEAFDTYLLLYSADGHQQLASDDDGGSGTDSRLTWTAAGPVRVVVRPYEARETGAYRLSVTTAAPDSVETSPATGNVAGFAAVARPLPADGRVSSTLDGTDARLPDDESLLEVWAFSVDAAERVEVVMESDAFDTYLHLAAPALGLVLTRDDDSAGGTDSRIEFTLPGAGEYLIVANGYDASSAGPYRLRVNRFPAAASSDDPRRALLVGINDYRGSDSDLTAPVLDALELRTVLIEDYDYPPENIELLTDGDATRDGILEAVSRHLGSAPVDGSALFFYSGHGIQLDDVRSMDASERDRIDEALYLADDSTLLDDELAALTRALPAQRVAVILDSCFSGGGFRAVNGRPKGLSENDLDAALPRADKRADAKVGGGRVNRVGAGGLVAGDPRRAAAGRSILEIAASREDQLSWQYSRWPDRSEPLSVFTYYLLEALREGARRGEGATFASAFDALRRQTTALTQRAFGRPQDPLMTASSPDAELLDVLRPAPGN